MSYPINYPTPQNANVQIFSHGGSTQDWIKPQGASFVWFTLIGAGGDGNGLAGGGSGAVTNFMCPAFLIPDNLSISVGGQSSRDTTVVYQQKDGTGYTLLTGTGTSSPTRANVMSANFFTAMGFFQSVIGMSGSTTSSGPSATTFLSAGDDASIAINANYGYGTTGSASNLNGFFQIQPIIVGVGGSGAGRGGIGCGGGISGKGGNGLAVIITW